MTIPTGGLSINSLSLSGLLQGSATTAAPGDVLTITSGGVVGSLSIKDATVNFPNGAYIHTASSNTVAGASRVRGSGGLAISSKGNLQFTNTPAGGNTFTGGLYINDNASVYFTANNQLGNDDSGHASGSIVLGGGSLFYAPNLATDTASLSDGGINRSIFVNESGGFIAGSQGILRIPGAISGPGQLQIGTDDGHGTVIDLTQSAGNTYTGGTVVRAGTLRISNPNQLGTGSLALNGGTLQPVGDVALSSTFQIGRSSAIDLQLGNLTLNGGANGSSNVAVSGGTPASVTLITTAGTGTLTIDGNSNFGGRLYDFAGHMLIKGLMSGTASVTIWSAGTFELGASYRLSSSTTLTLYSGTFVTGGFSEDLGALDMLSDGTPASIDLGDGSSRLTLADSHLSGWSGTLDIENWSGSPTGGGTDQIFFGASASGLTASQLAEITFVDPDGYAPGNYAAQLLPTGELVAVVPEPGCCVLVLCGGIALASRRRRERRYGLQRIRRLQGHLADARSTAIVEGNDPVRARRRPPVERFPRG